MPLLRERLALTVGGALALLTAAGSAQIQTPPEIGRLPVLASLPAGGACKVAPANEALRRNGITRLVMYSDSTTGRLVSVSVDTAVRPRTISAFANKRQGTRGETERLYAVIDAQGRVVRGDRSYFTTGAPARLADDRKAGLFPADSAQAIRSARALQRRCDK